MLGSVTTKIKKTKRERKEGGETKLNWKTGENYFEREMQRGFEQTVKGITKWSYEFLKGSDTEIPHREEKLYYHVIRLSNYIDRVTAFPLSWKKLQRPRFKIWIFDYTLFFLPSFLPFKPSPLALNRPQSLDIGVLHPRFQFHQTISPLQKLCEKMFEDRLETDIAELSLLSRITNLAPGANKATKVSSSTSILFDTTTFR